MTRHLSLRWKSSRDTQHQDSSLWRASWDSRTSYAKTTREKEKKHVQTFQTECILIYHALLRTFLSIQFRGTAVWKFNFFNQVPENLCQLVYTAYSQEVTLKAKQAY